LRLVYEQSQWSAWATIAAGQLRPIKFKGIVAII
jgi:hypothetical protein